MEFKLGQVYIGGLLIEHQKFMLNPIKWVPVLYRAYILLTTDLSHALDTFPKERVVVIRSRGDMFFCDNEAVAYLHAHGVHVVEIDGGHNWNKNTEDEMNRQIAYIQSKN